jgi:hypothetical protein
MLSYLILSAFVPAFEAYMLSHTILTLFECLRTCLLTYFRTLNLSIIKRYTQLIVFPTLNMVLFQ